jgi:hypothetical protein
MIDKQFRLILCRLGQIYLKAAMKMFTSDGWYIRYKVGQLGAISYYKYK